MLIWWIFLAIVVLGLCVYLFGMLINAEKF